MKADLDQQLIACLRRNARLSVSELARELGVARTTVQSKLNKLEHDGSILGYSLRLGRKLSNAEISATVLLEISPKALPAIIKALYGIADIRSVKTASGKHDLVLDVATANTHELDKLLDKIGQIDGVIHSESLVHLSTKFER